MRDAWCVVRDAWCVMRDAWCVMRDFSGCHSRLHWMFGFRFSDFGFRISDFGFRFSVFGFRFSMFKVQGSNPARVRRLPSAATVISDPEAAHGLAER